MNYFIKLVELMDVFFMFRLNSLIPENHHKQCWTKLLSKARNPGKKRLDEIFKKDTRKFYKYYEIVCCESKRTKEN